MTDEKNREETPDRSEETTQEVAQHTTEHSPAATNAAPPPTPPPTPPLPHAEPGRSPLSYKNPTLAAAFSIFPGLGHIYNGLYLRGLTFVVTFAALVSLASHGADIMGVGVAFFYLFNLFDSYRQATLINYGYATDLGITDRPRSKRPGSGNLVMGAVLFLIGLYAALDRFFHIDLDWLIDLAPFGLMALGAWIMWSALQQRKKEQEPTQDTADDDL